MRTGMKKPLNQLVVPTYPDIKKQPLRFAWSGKHWDVDAGSVMLDTVHNTQFIEPAVLTQSRDYNKTVYGQTSHRSTVNSEFRPPLLDPYTDFYPLNRIPVTRDAIIPHINPGTADTNTQGFTSKNERHADVGGAITDRISTGTWRPTFFCPLDLPQDNSVLPDLVLNTPAVSADAGLVYPAVYTPIGTDYELSHIELRPDGHAGIENPFKYDQPNPNENLVLKDNRPAVSASAGLQMPCTFDSQNPLEYIVLNEKPEAELSVLNPAPVGYSTPVDTFFDEKEFITKKKPNVSVCASKNMRYSERNGLTFKPQLRNKLQPLKSYGQISNSSAIPSHFIMNHKI